MIKRDMEKLVCHGVVAVPMRINKCIKHYISGIIDDRNGECGCSQVGGPNHAAALVGFGRDYSSEPGKCRDYWLLRNSWSERWGEGGYFRLCRDEEGLREGTCFIRRSAILPLMNTKRAAFDEE